MIVYLVTYKDFDDSVVAGVYADKAKAEKEADRLSVLNKDPYFAQVDEFEVID